jgi:hypothetical protein
VAHRDDRDEKTVDEELLDALALEAAAHLRRVRAPLSVATVVEELRRNGAAADDAADAVDHGVRTGALVMLGEDFVDAGIVRGWL